MAIIYVDSTAAGANNGTSWTDAYTSIASTTGAAAGDEIRVAHNHAQTASSFSLTWSNGTIANPIIILCVNSGTNALSTGAVIQTTAANSSSYNITLQGNLFVFGVTFKQANNLFLFGPTAGLPSKSIYDTCTFQQNFDRGVSSNWSLGPDNTGQQRIDLLNCTLDRSIRADWGTNAIQCRRTSIVTISNPTIVPASTTNGTFFNSNNTNNISVVSIFDADLSAFDSPVDLQSMRARVVRCKLKTGFTITSSNATPGDACTVEHCDDGTVTLPPLGLTLEVKVFGQTLSSLTRYRTGGADDGEQANAYSFAMTTNASARETYNPLEVVLGSRWVDAAASPSGATAQGIFTSYRAAPLDTPANLTTDASSTWNGTGVGTKQKIDHTLSNGDTLTVYVASGVTLQNDEFWIEVSEPDQVAGLVTVKAFLAKPSTTVYVDPKIEVA